MEKYRPETLLPLVFVSTFSFFLFSNAAICKAAPAGEPQTILQMIVPILSSTRQTTSEYLLEETLQGHIDHGEMIGGRLDETGWTNVTSLDMLVWDLEKEIESGSIEFDVKGLSPDTQGGTSSTIGKERAYYFGLYNRPSGDKGRCYDKSASLEVRLNLGIAYSKALKLQAGTATVPTSTHLECYPMYDMSEPFGSRNRGDWDPTHTYHHKIVFGGGQAELFIDGKSEVRAHYADKPLGWRYLYLGRNNYKYSSWPGPQDLTFSNLKVRDTSPEAPDYDYGDLPDPGFATLSASGGARHILDGKTYMGASVDADQDGQPTDTATGDDTNDSADEDGIQIDSPLHGGQQGFTLTVSVAGYINVWIDLNNSSSFDQEGEHVLNDYPMAAGATLLPLPVPAVNEPTQYFVRLRFTNESGQAVSPDGTAPNGEVEDYQVEVLP